VSLFQAVVVLLGGSHAGGVCVAQAALSVLVHYDDTIRTRFMVFMVTSINNRTTLYSAFHVTFVAYILFPS
jgi:hypothetical protein